MGWDQVLDLHAGALLDASLLIGAGS